LSTDDRADRVEQAATRIGTVLDERWVIESLLGIGGMAAVYAASTGDEQVAIKVLHPELTRSQSALDRFRREGDALRAARHPAVPRVHGEGTTADGCPYLVMDLLLGETVEARRRRFGGRLAPAEVVRIALDVLDVLDVVHGRGVLHRDVKPSNVLWLDDGSIRLIDFGIAKTTRGDEDGALTRTGALPGSLAFMSPEHALGVPSELDARSDLWSLGATMFLLLSGRPVHESQTEVGALALSASRGIAPLGSVASDLPPALIAVVDRALTFDRRRRFASAAEMREALLALSLESVHATPARSDRRRLVPAAAAAVLVLAGVGAWAAVRAHVEDVDRATPAKVSTSAQAPPASPSSVTPEGSGVIAEPVVAIGPIIEERPAERAPSAEPRSSRSARRPAYDAGGLTPIPSASLAAPRCDPPFVIDPTTGTRRVKPGC
jgi:serine/threonine protein kinase